MNRPKSKKKVVPTPKPLIVKSSANLSQAMYYALIGVITEVISDREKEKKDKMTRDPHFVPKNDFNESKIAKDIYDKLGKLYPLSTFNVVILNLVGGDYQFATSNNSTAYLSVSSGNRVFMIFKYKE